MKINVKPNDSFNQHLVDCTHPESYRNPEPNNPYNLVVIGGGTAGLVSAAAAAGLGARVALIEKHLMGGDCLNYGCVPSKALIRAATALQDARDVATFGGRLNGELVVDSKRVFERMRKLRAEISEHDSVKRFSELGVEIFLGEGRFTSSDTIQVGEHILKFKKAVIATGARASAPPIPGLEEAGYLTNESLFELEEAPRSLAVIGAGPIGCEMAQAFQRLGSDVTLVDIAPHVLIREDADAAEVIQRAMVKDGVTLALEVKDMSISHESGRKVVSYTDGAGKACRVEADEILVAAGRKPNVEGIGLEQAGVAFDPRKGVWVDDYLHSSNKKIFAAGDVASKYQFTHAADFLARIVITNGLFPGRSKASDLTIPWATYTDPQIAHVGITEHEAKEGRVELDTYTVPFDDVDRAILDGETEGFVKIHCAKGSDTILGGTIVARHAGDMIGEITLAITQGVGLGKVASVIHPYPTQAEAIRKAGDLYSRTRLTPSRAIWLKRWFDWLR